jgi:hypothetical protein
MFPDFKVFQLVSYNNFVDGGWGLLKFPFFNGDGTWLQNPVPDGFSTDARDFLRKSFTVLHRYSAAFTSRDVAPLVPTLTPAIYANRFTGGGHTVWTLYNAGWQTFRGPALAVLARPEAVFLDAFTGRRIHPALSAGQALLPVVIGPHDVGCIVEGHR